MTSHPHRDRGHHHPTVHRTSLGRWAWTCSCGGASCRTDRHTWHQVMVEALLHSMTIAP